MVLKVHADRLGWASALGKMFVINSILSLYPTVRTYCNQANLGLLMSVNKPSGNILTSKLLLGGQEQREKWSKCKIWKIEVLTPFTLPQHKAGTDRIGQPFWFCVLCYHREALLPAGTALTSSAFHCSWGCLRSSHVHTPGCQPQT